MTLGLGGIAIGVLFQVCSGDSDLSIIVTGLSFRCLSCLDSVAVLVVQVSNGSLRLVSQTSGVDRPGLSGRDGEGAVFFGGRQAGLQILRTGVLRERTARDSAGPIGVLCLEHQASRSILSLGKAAASHGDVCRVSAYIKVGVREGTTRNRNVSVIKCLDATLYLGITRNDQLTLFIRTLVFPLITPTANCAIDGTAGNGGIITTINAEMACIRLGEGASPDV